MEKRTLKQRIKQNPALKQAVHRFIMHPVKTRISETWKRFRNLSQCPQRPSSF